MSLTLLEVAITTADDARRAVAAGADRLELCSALEVGGVTPSAGTFLHVRDAVSIPVWVLVRPRLGNFRYSLGEFSTLKHDAEWFLNHGADGIVVGVLTADRRIDCERSAELAAIAKGRATFHRAFDFTPDRLAALEDVIGCGFARLLTSGGVATALDGADEIANLIRAANGRIEILPGGGVSPDNVKVLIRQTGCTQVHGSFRTETASVGLGMGDGRTTDEEMIRAVKAQARIASG